MGVTSSDPKDNPGLQDYVESTLEQAQNKKNKKFLQENGFQKFPMAVYKPGGLHKRVEDEAGLADALKKGWYEDWREVPSDGPTEEPTHVSGMTLAQAKPFIAKATASELAVIEADEASHGNRPAVMKLIDEAKDAVGAPPKAAAKAAKPKKPAKK